MTTVNVTTESNSVIVSQGGSTTVVQAPVTTTVTATTAGPQGPVGQGFALDSSAKVDKSVIYYDSASAQFKADANWTIESIVLGGNF